MNFEWKSLMIGALLTSVLFLALGATGGGSNSFGIAVPENGKILVKDRVGNAILVDAKTGESKLVIYKKPDPDAPNYPSPSNGYELKLF